MIARLQRLAMASLFLLFAAAMTAAVWLHQWPWALLPLLLTGGIHFAVLFGELCLQRGVSRRRGESSLTLRLMFKAAWRETRVAISVFGWRQPFRHGQYLDQPSSSRPGRGVVLVHGFYCNRALWNPWLAELKRRGVAFIAVDLEPPFGSIDGYAGTIDSAVRQLQRTTGVAPVIVGHSMGGIAARAWLDSSDGEDRAHRIITIGSPHHGTMLGRFARAINARQMSSDSEWLRRLEEREPSERRRRFTCFYSDYDNVIVPAASARWPAADNRRVLERAHLDLLSAPEVFDEVLRSLDTPAPAAN